MATLALPLNFVNGGQSTCASSITNAQTTAVLASTATFGATGNYIVRIDDTGSPGSTKFEYVLVTANNTGTNTLTFTRAQDNTSAQSFAAGATFTAYLTAGMLGAFPIKLNEVVLGASTTSVTFSSIPQSYQHLQFDWLARGDNAAAQQFIIELNSDFTLANYNSEYFAAGGSTNQVPSNQNMGLIGYLPGTGVMAGQFACGRTHFPVYAGTTAVKCYHSETFTPVVSNATIQLLIAAGYWNNTAAINTARFLPNIGNLIAGTVISMYGWP